MAKSSHKHTFPLVGIGASAGGIESFKRFLGAVPDNSGMAYILVQHLSPSHESLLPEILSRSTNVPVSEITDDCELEPDHIYVIPENSMLEVTDHSLRLTPRKNDVHHMPIDVFFTSLAKVHNNLAMGIVLSGTARDGTVGLQHIKEHGGITFAEDPKSATWDGMPKNAIEAGVVDFILLPEEMRAKLMQVKESYGMSGPERYSEDPEVDGDILKKILSVVRQKSGVDFNCYKKPTVLRRLDRRMAINQIAGHRDYLEYLSGSTTEQAALFQDLLIKVTSFFRDADVFEELEKTVFPKLLSGKSEDDPFRMWVAGCATGEEVYSLSICLFDTLNRSARNRDHKGIKIQIFASDISESAINKARTGLYSANELQHLSEKLLSTYFTRTDGNYRVIKSIRDTIVFTVHNFIKDPPFGNVDMISCRNVFIYLDPLFQKNALTIFHYALRENGLLLLGKSESIAKPMALFAPFSQSTKLYSRKPGRGRFLKSSTKREQTKTDPTGKKEPSSMEVKMDFRRDAEAVLISEYTPAHIIVDERSEVVHVEGDIGPFLEVGQGRPSSELLKMARKELAFELRNALHKARESRGKVFKEAVSMKTESEQFLVDLEIVPLTRSPDPYYLIVFRKRTPHKSFMDKVLKKLGPTFKTSEQNPILRRNTTLEKEMEQLRDDTRRISEDQDAYNEELQSANEELLSSNEEMQSLNEELETSKEELQSTNEELVVVNRELLDKQDELSEALQFSDNIISTVREPFLVLDQDLRILKTNAAYHRRFDTGEQEIDGKLFFEIQDGQWDHAELRSLLQKMLPEKQRIIDEEMLINLPGDGERILVFNAREILREKRSDKLILLAISDITKRKKVEKEYLLTIEELRATNEQLDQFVHVASHDLQEPLRKIMTFANRLIIRGQNVSPQNMEMYLKKIESSSERMSALIKNMLNYARLAHDAKSFETVNLNGIMTDVIADFELLIEQKGAQINIGQLHTLDAIPLQINQLFYNLVSNALKFSEENVSPIISITSRRYSQKEVQEHPSLSPELSYYELIVRDNGIGFGPKYQEQIFTIFQRLNPTSQYLGTGVGLALCKKIAQTHHGDIFARSKEGEGAAFHVILPQKQPGK